jgi:hypothetical protein
VWAKRTRETILGVSQVFLINAFLTSKVDGSLEEERILVIASVYNICVESGWG